MSIKKHIIKKHIFRIKDRNMNIILSKSRHVNQKILIIH